MKTYTPNQIKECKQYLWFSVKEGYMGEEEAEDLLKREAWEEVYHLMNLGDYYANDMEERGDDSGKYESDLYERSKYN